MVPRRITPRSPANTFNPLLFLVSAISEKIIYLKSIWLQSIYGKIVHLDFHIEKNYHDGHVWDLCLCTFKENLKR
jgi:hypothetical protein